MSLSDWAKAGWLRSHRTSRQQIADLFAIVDRDLEDAGRGLSPDWQFGIAYNAVLKLCTVLVHAEGWRPEKTSRTIARCKRYRSFSAQIAMPMPHISKRAAPSATSPNMTRRGGSPRLKQES